MAKVCSTCGFDITDNFIFCPNCGSKIESGGESSKEKYKFCPICAKQLEYDAMLCPYCGTNFDRIYRKIVKKYSKNKSVNKVLDFMGNTYLKHNFMLDKLNRKNLEHDDPAFLSIYDSIVGESLKKLFLLERYKLMVVGGAGPLGYGPEVFSPTRKLSYDEAVEFYENLLEKTISELNEAKQKENFDEDEYIKNKYKESTIEVFSNMHLL